MTLRTCDGRLLLRAAAGATTILVRHAAEVDALNVFPVPDGDTGRNMLATMRAATDAAAALPAGTRSAERVGAALARGALLGARGNSGVILSQVFRGLAEGAADRRRVDGRDLARGLRAASRHADAAVDRPVEGTILSVVRAAAEAAEAAALRDPSVEAVLADAAGAAAAAVLRTPEQLAVLRDAGVVDAGGRGFELLLRGALAALAEDPGPVASVAVTAAGAVEHGAHAGPEGEAGSVYGFETAYLVLAPPGGRLDAAALRAELAPLGDSLLVVGDTELLRVHIHGDRPDLALAAGLRAGRLRRVTIENLDALAAGDREERVGELLGLTDDALPGHGPSAPPVAVPPAPMPVPPPAADLAVVAVAAGEGIARILGAAGAHVVAPAPGHDRPSTGELLAAIRAASAPAVLLLPNDRNVRLAADAAAGLADPVAVSVIPTRTPQEGIAALLAWDGRADVAAVAARMAAAAAGVRGASVATASRDARVGGRPVRSGETIVLDAEERLLAQAADPATAVIAALATFGPGIELVTLLHGADIDLADALALAAAVEEARPDLAVEVAPGGQPHIGYLLAVE